MTTVYCTEGGARLDVFLADETEFTRSHIKKLIDCGAVRVSGVVAAKCGMIVKTGDEVSFEDETVVSEVVPQDIPLDIVYEDGDIAVVNKQRGLVVHPGAGNPDGTLVNALLYRYGDELSLSGGVSRAGIVHRLDKDTTGLIVCARTDAAHAALSLQFAARTVKKFYRAVLDGSPKADSGRIEAPIDRDRKNRLKMSVAAGGRYAATGYNVLERYSRNSYVEFELFTGRTHQIRVHAAYIGHPVSCDPLYGGSTKLGCAGQLLHSRKICFDHPRTGERLQFEAEEPADFQAALSALRAQH